MKLNKILTALLLSAVSLGLISCNDQTAQVGKPAPELAAFDLQGNAVSLENIKGNTTLLIFWSETCGICVAELKEFQQMAEKHPNKIKLLAINVDGEKADTQAVVNKRHLTLPVVKDQLKITAERYQLQGTPTSFLIGADGIIQQKFEGKIEKNELEHLFTQG
ncbi:thiol-disulfide isomerase/thioredoxin [Cricetibacter osteomyelitidis]|uniref:Thiol-disulfide isomerase/thioredoxin n=1 Tax=Cricetibacter osteomyelitidis TaxID=1521931 RepID=A0A4R2TBU1_9PAST|nr:TlpA disulfide reductase family protein [Cricetibacter osteomyelitidis]TCP92202.1 thiol-disulfide isomerase/thioredoxin [Cricetibacter osteomyelitidis]